MTIKRVKTKEAQRLQVALKNLDGKVGKVGWVHASQYIESRESVAAVAAQNEYGNPNKHIPARPFMRPTIEAESVNWSKIIEHGSKQVLKGNQTIGDVFETVGLKAAGDIRKTITKITTPPLSPVTIAARLNRRKDKNTIGNLTKPLVDTGIMLGTLTNTVEDER